MSTKGIALKAGTGRDCKLEDFVDQSYLYASADEGIDREENPFALTRTLLTFFLLEFVIGLGIYRYFN